MTSRPRVQASHSREAVSIGTLGGRTLDSPPSVEVSVEFDLHDHERAMNMLVDACEDVLNQIKQTDN